MKKTEDWIVNFMLDNSRPPIYEEIAAGLGITKNTARIRCFSLEELGRLQIERTGHQHYFILVKGVYFLDDREV